MTLLFTEKSMMRLIMLMTSAARGLLRWRRRLGLRQQRRSLRCLGRRR